MGSEINRTSQVTFLGQRDAEVVVLAIERVEQRERGTVGVDLGYPSLFGGVLSIEKHDLVHAAFVEGTHFGV